MATRKTRRPGRKAKGQAHPFMALTDAVCRRAMRDVRPGDAVLKLNDGNGLMLVVEPTGAARWGQRLTVAGTGQRVTGGHGPYPLVSLRDARKLAIEARHEARAGRNPFPKSAHYALRHAGGPTVADAVEAMLADKVKAGRIKATSDKPTKHLRAFRRHAPTVAALPIATATTDNAAADLRKVESATIAKTMRELLQAAGAWAVANKHRADNPFVTATLNAVVTPRKAETTHRAAVPFVLIGEALATVEASRMSERDKVCLKLIVMTGCRVGEAMGADWGEFELDGATPTWTVPAARMKMNRKHAFPLSTEIVAMLRDYAEATDAHMAGGAVFAFPRKPNGTISNAMGRTMRKRGGLGDARFADRETGEAPTVHGFRNAFADWCAERGRDGEGWPGELIDAHLAHQRGAVTEAYQRTGRKSQRRAMVAEWTAWLDAEIAEARM